MRSIKQSTATNVMVLMVDSADHITGKTGLTLTVTASKDGAAFASISPTVTERSNGWYSIALTTAHTDTLGDLVIRCTGTGADPGERVLAVTGGLVDADVSTRLATAGYTTPLDAAGVRSAVGLATANLDTQVAAVKSDTAAILLDTGTDGVVVASGSKSGYALSATGLDAVVIETGCSARQALSVIAAASAGQVSGAGTGTVTLKGAGVATTRIVATTDADGNRSAVTLTLPS